MKNLLKNFLVLSFLGFLVLTSCQDEVTELPDEEETEVIAASSDIADLITKTTLLDGSKDNIIDQASCTTVVFPVTVFVNDVKITIESEEGLDFIEEIYDEYEDDIDELSIQFPINIILGDYTQITIDSQQQLESVIEECGEDQDIECVDFEYPVSISVYDANNEILDTKTFQSDESLFGFFAELKENEFVSFNYPIKLVDYEGTQTVINNNAELEEALEVAKNECDEDDDNDYNDDDFDIGYLNEYLATCRWRMEYIKRNGQNQTEQYPDVYFVFKENNTIVATFPDTDIEGTWETTVTEGDPVANINFQIIPDFSNQWKVGEVGEGKIKLYNESEEDKIILKKDCSGGLELKNQFVIDGTEPKYGTPNAYYRDQLSTINQGKFELHLVNGEVRSNPWGDWDDYVEVTQGVIINLKSSDVEIIAAGTYQYSQELTESTFTVGTRAFIDESTTSSSDIEGITITGGTVEVTREGSTYAINYNFTYDGGTITGQYEGTLQYISNSGHTQNDVAALKDYIASSDWVVNSFVSDYQDDWMDDDITSDYSDYLFVFDFENSTVAAISNAGTVAGVWSVLLEDNKMMLNLSFDTNGSFTEFNRTWQVHEYSATSITLKTNGNDVITELIFTKAE
ncbi:hypothetical protein [Abyssalbus ytuae]|uniref:Lipocalin-like domain-containing protein n=1 Tax=Abyssalbus ytuae TaxID=2926907 RepID=A0A9E7D290_9FLAO|nr:hypothetical protein [Abyssalbus ytuae]UOB16434.1 hypothetical protein MQE35_11880 [Abyssalbus ytuae]